MRVFGDTRDSLAIKNPKLAQELHPSKNGVLALDDVTTGSPKRVWWQCEKGHEWEAAIANRSKGNGCPFCTGRRVCDDNSLQTLYPDLAKQWHPTKNGDLTPNDITTGSGKKVWWQCEKGHEWEAAIFKRVTGRSCPFCAGNRACADNSLKTLNPDLAKQWHPTKNGDLTPDDVTISSGKRIWWICEKGHEWEAVSASRANGIGCPFCTGRSVSADNSLKTLNPDLAKQWHPTKNRNLTPDDVTMGSNKKVWWICKKGHEWEALINNRTKGIGCPICNQEKQTSFPEQAIYFYLKKEFNDTLNRYKYNNKWEIDVFIPSLNFGIEYDGIYYHQNKKDSDSKKEKHITDKGICLLIIKETEKNILKINNEKNIIYCNKKSSEFQLNEIIKACFRYISENITGKSYINDIDIKRDRIDIYNSYMRAEEENSLFLNYPELSQQWHPTKNMNVKPKMVKPSSNKKVWWICEKGHEWEALINNRVKGNGCPFCAGKRTSNDNSLKTLNPDLAKQWHSTKNGDLTPVDVTIGSTKKVWWQCEKGHEWETTVANRRSNGCPFCSGKRR